MTTSWFTAPEIDRKATPIPEGFQPNRHHRALAAELGVDLEEEFSIFVDHHLSKGNKFKSWDRALNTWIMRAKQFSRNRPSDSQFVFKTPERAPCPVGFCDGSGWFIDHATRRRMDCECKALH
jgi:hypothetical protein